MLLLLFFTVLWVKIDLFFLRETKKSCKYLWQLAGKMAENIRKKRIMCLYDNEKARFAILIYVSEHNFGLGIYLAVASYRSEVIPAVGYRSLYSQLLSELCLGAVAYRY